MDYNAKALYLQTKALTKAKKVATGTQKMQEEQEEEENTRRPRRGRRRGSLLIPHSRSLQPTGQCIPLQGQGLGPQGQAVNLKAKSTEFGLKAKALTSLTERPQYYLLQYLAEVVLSHNGQPSAVPVTRPPAEHGRQTFCWFYPNMVLVLRVSAL
jgi:hypothetical protein